MSVTHEEGIKAAERLRGLIVQLQHADVIRLEQLAKRMLSDTAPQEPGVCPTPLVKPTKARALVTVYMADGDAGSFDEVVAAVREAVTKNIAEGDCAVHMSEVTA